ncbi:MAG: protocatechuate 3,4-dioxygenase [Planctomycetota bacterium]
MHALSALHRRRFLHTTLTGAAGLYAPGVFAEALTLTPRMTEGPFYPDHLPLDTDNDLLTVNDGLTPAVGEVTHLTGRVLDMSGSPLRNVAVEIWQVDSKGAYIHTDSARRGSRDTNFQGFGRFLTNAKGEYYFRTIKPVAYGSRTPHIHFAVNRGDRRLLTTQMLVRGEPQNERDGLFRRFRKGPEREAILADFVPVEGSSTGELQASFDLVLGVTPEDA